MNESDWQPVAERYVKVEDARLARLFPAAIELIRAENTQSMLDYGCGDGIFADQCLTAGIPNVSVFDPTPRMRELADARLKRWGSRVKSFSDPGELPNDEFGVATFMAVWMCLRSRDECITTLTRIRNCLQTGGLLIASVTHPCFRDRRFSTFRTSFKMENYAQEGRPFQVTMFDGENECEFTDYHWSLGEMSRQLRDARFVVEELVEIPDVEINQSPRVFPWLVFCARRM